MNTAPARLLQYTIWVIDDDETALILSESILTDAGFVVRTFNNAADALAAAAGGLPDIIVVDIVMPGIDGYEFCTRLRRLPGGAGIPILVTTALEDTATMDRAYEAGATNFATKPIHWGVEVQRLHYMLKSARIARELQRNEQESRLAREDWEKTFNAIPDIVTVLDTNLHILRANHAAARLFRKPVEEILGQLCCQVFHGSATVCAECCSVRALREGRPVKAEVKFQTLGAEFEVSVSPIFDAQHKVTRLVHVARDLREQKQLEAKLRQSQKMEAIGTLAGGIAHDFNNILTAIVGNTELALLDATHPSVCESLGEIRTASNRARDLVKQILSFSRRQEQQREPLHLWRVTSEAMQLLRAGIPATIDFRIKLAKEAPPVLADPTQMHQVIMNLCTNAAHAMEEVSQGVLTVSIDSFVAEEEFTRLHPDSHPGTYTRLSITDTGRGMDRATLARIFEPFFTTKEPGKGTGLGLSAVHGIVHSHGGFISVYSQPGEGTTFHVFFPALEIEVAEAVSPPPTIVRGTGQRILVIDDEPANAQAVGKMLLRLGYAVEMTSDVRTAVPKVLAGDVPYDLVVTDLTMPGTTGLNLVAEARAKALPVRFLLMTGLTTAATQESAHAHGLTEVLAKPLTILSLSEAVSRALRQPLPSGPVGPPEGW